MLEFLEFLFSFNTNVPKFNKMAGRNVKQQALREIFNTQSYDKVTLFSRK